MAIKFNKEFKGVNHTTGNAIIAYPFLGEPDKPKDPQIEPAYGCKLAFPKDDKKAMEDFQEFQKDVMLVVKSAFPGITKAELKTIGLPWKDGDEDFEGAKASFSDFVRGCWVIEPKRKLKNKDGTTNPPIPCFDNAKTATGQLVKRQPGEIVSGNIVRASIRLFAYSGFGGGVTARLSAVQYREEGVPLFSNDYGFGEDTPVRADDISSDLDSFM